MHSRTYCPTGFMTVIEEFSNYLTSKYKDCLELLCFGIANEILKTASAKRSRNGNDPYHAYNIQI